MTEGDTVVNALIGAAINVLAGSIVPFATVFGGAVAGYLQGGSREDGLKVGALAGLIAFVPFLLVTFLMGNILLGVFLGGFGVPRLFSGLGIVFLGFVLVVLILYTVVASAAGGWLGNYVRYETDI